jgi:phage FluMu protein Com
MESRSQFKPKQNDGTPKAETALRCDCGSLLARLVAQGVEIKCRRCKRHVIVPRDAKGKVRIDV